MSSPQERMQAKFEELKEKLKAPKIVKSLSDVTIRFFCMGFYIPLIASLEYLKLKTATHKEISCSAKIEKGKTYIINDHSDYDVFAKGLEDIIAPTYVEFIFNLTKSTYCIGDVRMGDIHALFTVYFHKEEYILTYVENGQDLLRYTRPYDQDLEPDEMLAVRDAICNYIFNKMTENMGVILEKI